MLTILTLTTLVSVHSQAETTCTTNAFGDRTCTTTTTGTTTGNVLTNSTFGTGNTTTTTGWSTDGDHGVHTHGNFGFTYPSGADTSGGVLAFEGDPDDNVFQDVDLVGDGHLTQAQINEGFTSTMSADVWFWNNLRNEFTMKQTITAADGTVTTQTRTIIDHDPSRSFNGGSFTNETNTYTHSANTQNDFTIRTEMYNNTVIQSYDNIHRGPDVDNVQLSITTAGAQSIVVTPCFVLGTCTSIGEDVEDAVNLETDDGVDLFEDLDTKVEDALEEFEDSQFTDNFFKPEIELTIIVEDEFGYDEMPFEEFVMEEFTDFLETNDLTDSFQQELIVEDITEQQFFDELADQMVEELGGPSLDAYFEGESEIYLTDSEMNDVMEANPEMFEQVDENTILIKPPSDMMTENDEMFNDEMPMIEEDTMVTELPPDMREVKEEPEMLEESTNEEIIEESPTNKPEDTKSTEVSEDTTTETKPTREEPNDITNEKSEAAGSEETMETNEENESNGQESENVSTESKMDENKETKGQTETEADSETMEGETNEPTETKIATIKDRSIEIKVKKIIEKVMQKLKKVDQQLQAIQIITSKGITADGADLSGYINKRIYTNQVKLNGVPNDEFFNTINILEQQQIYKDANLAAYTSNDPIAVKQKLLQEIKVDKERLLLEIRKLKNG